ncbi:hypothetical protein [Pseudomonas lundensis]|uniref:hypothetical protein n=1 Tax=Pseudomonas lundensis TaxID=86185 RepID=UPI001472BC77|nr:hypothetical protein [Pseudomonas lundensis]NNA32865.1 hypothetical protein [Pseudomonas lundensis]
MSQERELAQTRGRSVTRQIDLAPLVLRAGQELRPTWQGDFDSGLDATVCSLGVDPMRKQEALTVLEQQTGGPLDPAGELAIFVNGEQNDFNAACLASLWVHAFEPVSGWGRTNAPAFSKAAQNEMATWANNQLAASIAVSATMAPIAEALAARPGATVAELEQGARELLVANGTEYRKLFSDELQKNIGRVSEVVLNLSSNQPAPVNILLADMELQMGAWGAKVIQGGTTRFGEGYLENVRYTVEAVTGGTASMAKRSSGSLTEEVSSGTTASQGASLR